MVHGDCKDFPRETGSIEVLRNKTFNIAKNLKYDGYLKALPLMVYKFSDCR